MIEIFVMTFILWTAEGETTKFKILGSMKDCTAALEKETLEADGLATGSCIPRWADPGKPLILGESLSTHWWVGMETSYSVKRCFADACI